MLYKYIALAAFVGSAIAVEGVPDYVASSDAVEATPYPTTYEETAPEQPSPTYPVSETSPEEIYETPYPSGDETSPDEEVYPSPYPSGDETSPDDEVYPSPYPTGDETSPDDEYPVESGAPQETPCSTDAAGNVYPLPTDDTSPEGPAYPSAYPPYDDDETSPEGPTYPDHGDETSPEEECHPVYSTVTVSSTVTYYPKETVYEETTPEEVTPEEECVKSTTTSTQYVTVTVPAAKPSGHAYPPKKDVPAAPPAHSYPVKPEYVPAKPTGGYPTKPGKNDTSPVVPGGAKTPPHQYTGDSVRLGAPFGMMVAVGVAAMMMF